MNEEITCPVCGIKQINGNFYFSHSLKKPNPMPTSPDEVATRVCQYAKKPGCINNTGSKHNNLAYESELPEWESVTKHYMKSITENPI